MLQSKQTLRSPFGRTLVLLLGIAICATAPAAALSLTILHTNDTHGHLRPFSYPETFSPGSTIADLTDRSDIGGIARRATLARQIRERLAVTKTPVWLIDAGDFCDGTPFSTEYHGDADVAAMNAAHYNFATLGNHEFNNTLAQVRKLVADAAFPILCANVTLGETGEPLGEAYRIESVGPLRVGLFGLVTTEAAGYPAAREGIEITDPVTAARGLVDRLQGRADILIAITHVGLDVDERLAAEVPEIDVIVGAHSHSRLPTGELIWRAEDLSGEDIGGPLIVQAHQWGGELGRLDLHFSQDGQGVWHVDRYRERLIPVTEIYHPDPEVEKAVASYWDPIAERYGEVVGQATADFAGRGDDRAEYNLVADAIRASLATEIEMENLGGVRAPLVKGPITLEDLTTLDPFSNTIVTFRVTGAQIRDILLRHAPAVSGIRYRIEGGQLVEASVNGQPLDDGRVYSGATNSYFAGRALEGIEKTDTGRPRLEVLTDYIRDEGTIRPAYNGRRVVIR